MLTSLRGCWEAGKPTQDANPNEDWPEIAECLESQIEGDEGEYVDTTTPSDIKKVRQLLTVIDRDWRTRLQTVVSLEVFRKELSIINCRLDRLEQEAPLVIPVQSLAPEQYEVIKPLLAVVRMVDSEYVASFVDANVASSGETEDEAVLNLKDAIVSAFDVLSSATDSELGPGPLRQKRTLEEFIRRKL
jgi:predicted RNase H-like HicB family nuclease